MPYILVEQGSDKVSAVSKLSKQEIGYVYTKHVPVKGIIFLEVEQLFVSVAARGEGLGTRLFLEAIKKALKEKIGLHMQIQPGSAGFYNKLFRQYFFSEKITLFSLGKGRLNTQIFDNAVLDIPFGELVAKYRYPNDPDLRCKAVEKLCKDHA